MKVDLDDIYLVLFEAGDVCKHCGKQFEEHEKGLEFEKNYYCNVACLKYWAKEEGKGG